MTENEVRHLEMIQGVVSRMSANSFSLKTWTVTLVAAIFALSAKDADHRFLVVALIPTLGFWGLDGYFLAQERRYRRLFDIVRADPSSVDAFSMSALPHSASETVFSAAASSTLTIFYGCLIVAVAIVSFILR